MRELGIGVTAYGVLSRGLLSGSTTSSPGDFRSRLPRFTGENRARNEQLVAALAAIAAGKGISTSQLAIAWALGAGDTIVPVDRRAHARAAGRGARRPRDNTDTG